MRITVGRPDPWPGAEAVMATNRIELHTGAHHGPWAHWQSGNRRTRIAAAARPGPGYDREVISGCEWSLPVRQAIDQAPSAVRGWSGCSSLVIS